MTKKVVGYGESEDILDAVKTMGDMKVLRLPVVNDRDQLVGVVSLADIAQEMRHAMDSRFDEISRATKYAVFLFFYRSFSKCNYKPK